MKNLTIILSVLFFSLNTNLAQDIYLLDSVTTITLSGGSSGSTHASKYKYDEQHRLISHTSVSYESINEYSNQYDFVNVYTTLQNNLAYSRTAYTHDDEGFLIESFQELNDLNTNTLIPTSRRIFEYDQDKRLINDENYYIDVAGSEKLSEKKTFSYNENGIEEEVVTSYLSNSSEPNQIYTITHSYENGQIILSVIVVEYTTQTNTSDRIYTYEEDKLISIEEQIYSDGQLSNAYLNIFEYSDHGVYNYYFTKFTGSSEYIANATVYDSEYITDFFEKDTSILIYQFGDDILDEQKMYNSVSYTANEDTAIVRRERRNQDFQLGEIIRVSKEIHLRIEGVNNSILEAEIVCKIAPNPVISNGFFNLKRINSTINKFEIFNMTGQRVHVGSIWTENLMVKSPNLPGQYYIRFYDNDEAIGKIIKLNVF